MPRVEIDMDSTAAPEDVRRALLDFGPDRPKIWPGIEPSLYEVKEMGNTWADIKEGSKMPGGSVWAVEHYDWSDPQTVKWTVKESNFSAPGSFVSARITPGPTGGSHIHLTWNRTGSNLLGKVITWMIKASGGKPVSASMRKGLETIERRSTVGAGSAK